MSSPPFKRCEVVYARPEEQVCIDVQVPASASVGEVLTSARAASGRGDIPWETDSLGIFGERCPRSRIPEDGDRIEIYRDLQRDPRRARLEDLAAQRRAARAKGRA